MYQHYKMKCKVKYVSARVKLRIKIFAHFYILSALVNEMNEFVSNLRNYIAEIALRNL